MSGVWTSRKAFGFLDYFVWFCVIFFVCEFVWFSVCVSVLRCVCVRVLLSVSVCVYIFITFFLFPNSFSHKLSGQKIDYTLFILYKNSFTRTPRLKLCPK